MDVVVTRREWRDLASTYIYGRHQFLLSRSQVEKNLHTSNHMPKMVAAEIRTCHQKPYQEQNKGILSKTSISGTAASTDGRRYPCKMFLEGRYSARLPAGCGLACICRRTTSRAYMYAMGVSLHKSASGHIWSERCRSHPGSYPLVWARDNAYRITYALDGCLGYSGKVCSHGNSR
jgi:hypothetical protein